MYIQYIVYVCLCMDTVCDTTELYHLVAVLKKFWPDCTICSHCELVIVSCICSSPES